ncbi:MAG: rhamnogalacturonan lyase [Bacteroidaceae bacterium]|nr:rhamnogalacturonan lyase [Bacteroidaceae bacterium]
MKTLTSIALFAMGISNMCAQGPHYDYKNMQRESLNRGVVAVRTEGGDSAIVSWRYLEEDPMTTAFNVYKDGKRINSKPIAGATHMMVAAAKGAESKFEVRTVDGGKESHRKYGTYTLSADAPSGYLSIPLSIPEGGTTPDGRRYSYSANDCSVGDVDGDGEYEIILKWDPNNARDNAHDGYTGNVIFDCYKLDGTHLWRIDLGHNIRAGAHYTQFMVFDLDGDGRAEVVMKTSDGTTDSRGRVIGDPTADYRTHEGRLGRILSGNEYLTVFSGLTGEAMCTVDYVPTLDTGDWGDDYGNRSERYLACVAYLDGRHPSVVMCRGYYARTTLTAWDWDGKTLKQRWAFDSQNPGMRAWGGQGNHNLRVGDVDGDGRDEIVYGSMCVDDNGTGLWNTHMGHGDAMHLMAFYPDSDKLQVWDVHENKRDGSTLVDAATGEVIFQIKSNTDVGRGMAADIDPTNPGLEMWSSASGGILNTKGEVVSHARVSTNFAIWWSGALNRELLDGARITRLNPQTQEMEVIADFTRECAFNNGTKSNPCLEADIVGDWREEVLIRTRDSRELRIYITPHATPYRFHTFMQDIPYRISVATQNVAYNQPSEPGFYFGSDFKKGQTCRGWTF